MTLDEAAKAFRRAEHTLEQRRAALVTAIVEATQSGTAQVDIVRITGYSREQVRRILRKAGVEAED